MHKVEVDETTYQTAVSKKDENIPEIDNAFVHAANVLGEKICDAVGIEPWKGYIISKSDDRITISSGRRSGLGPGDIPYLPEDDPALGLEIYSRSMKSEQ
ncbi:MAG: hypothetical protein JRI88_06045 [Deltaproteobacteria bacterium]|nr:hypothetical protein [Deltaproteobacteria bacterium]